MTSRDGRSKRRAENGAVRESSPMSVFRSVSMIDVLEQDPRPAFVVDLYKYGETSDEPTLVPIFCNKAFREQRGLGEVIRGQIAPVDYGQPSASTYGAFARWVIRKDGLDVIPRGFSCESINHIDTIVTCFCTRP